MRQVIMLEIKPLHLAQVEVVGEQWPVHGFVVTHPGGALLVDTGVGGPDEMLSDWRVGNPPPAHAPAHNDRSPADIHLVINRHPHFDHFAQNAVVSPSPCYAQPAEGELTNEE